MAVKVNVLNEIEEIVKENELIKESDKKILILMNIIREKLGKEDHLLIDLEEEMERNAQLLIDELIDKIVQKENRPIFR